MVMFYIFIIIIVFLFVEIMTTLIACSSDGVYSNPMYLNFFTKNNIISIRKESYLFISYSVHTKQKTYRILRFSKLSKALGKMNYL